MRPWRPVGRGQTVERGGLSYCPSLASAGVGRGRPIPQLIPSEGEMDTESASEAEEKVPQWREEDVVGSPDELPMEGPSAESDRRVVEFKDEVAKEEAETEGEESQSTASSQDPKSYWVGPRSGKRQRTWRESVRDSTCPVYGCPVFTRNVKDHVLEDHLSQMFRECFPPDKFLDAKFQDYRGHMVMVLAQWFCGDGVTAQSFVRFLNEKVRLPKNCRIPFNAMPSLRAVCKQMGWEECGVYHLHPINSPVCILHWRVATALLGRLTERQQELMWEENYDPTDPVNPDLLRRENTRFVGARSCGGGARGSQTSSEPTKQTESTDGSRPEDLILFPAGSEGNQRRRLTIRVDPPLPGRKPTVPTAEGRAKTPMADRRTPAPTAGRGSAVPTPGGSQKTPKADHRPAAPTEGRGPATPPAGTLTTVPKTGRDTPQSWRHPDWRNTKEEDYAVDPFLVFPSQPPMAILVHKGNRLLVSARSTAELREIAHFRFPLRGRVVLLTADGLELDDSVDFTLLGDRPELHVRERYP